MEELPQSSMLDPEKGSSTVRAVFVVDLREQSD